MDAIRTMHGNETTMRSMRMKTTLASLFPNASASTLAANPQLSASATVSPETKTNESTGILKRKRGKMTGVEKEFGLMLETQKRNGEIRDYLFQPFALPWGFDPDTGKPMFYTPDWMATPTSGKRRMIEIKDQHIHYRQQAIARFKGCRAWWPEFQFELWQRQKSGWVQLH